MREDWNTKKNRFLNYSETIIDIFSLWIDARKKAMHLRNSVSLPGVFSSISNKYVGILEMNIGLGSF